MVDDRGGRGALGRSSQRARRWLACAALLVGCGPSPSPAPGLPDSPEQDLGTDGGADVDAAADATTFADVADSPHAPDVGSSPDGVDASDAGSETDAPEVPGPADAAEDVGPPPGPGPPWTVFTAAGSAAATGDQLLVNPSYELLGEPPASFADWEPYQGGYEVGLDAGRAGHAVHLHRPQDDETQYGAVQMVTLAQEAPRALHFSGWSRAEGVTGDPDKAYAIYLDVYYVTAADDPEAGCDATGGDPCALYGQTPSPGFDTGTHGWQRREGVAIPTYPIDRVYVYLLLRGGHTGDVWFDDLTLAELGPDPVVFDGRAVVPERRDVGHASGPGLSLETEDGLGLTVWSGGGALKSLTVDGADQLDPTLDHRSAFFVHDLVTDSWVAPGGLVTAGADGLHHTASLASLSLDFEATYEAGPDHVSIRVDVVSLTAEDRAVTVYFALPLAGRDAWWGDDIRRSRPAGGDQELSNTASWWYDALGSTGQFSRYPLATVFDGSSGLVLAYPLDAPRIARLAFHPVTRQLYAAFDLALTPSTTSLPGRAWAELMLYRTKPPDVASGFRSALAGYRGRRPDLFERRIPPEKEGVWVAFADLSAMVHGPGESLDDFHIGIHETGALEHVAFDDAHDILSLRYMMEPGSTWLKITDPAVDPESYDDVLAHLQTLYESGSPWEQDRAAKTLSSGVFDADGLFAYTPFADGPPWCDGPCARFHLSSDPDIDVPPYELNHATFHWNDAALATYDAFPGLDGEYIDSFLINATLANHREEHLAAANLPATFLQAPPHRVVIPVVFSTIEVVTWLRPEIPAGKYLIANAILAGVPWGAHLFDFMGQEVDWVKEVDGAHQLVPESDELLSYRRSLAYQRPYGFLMNTDFEHLDHEMVERYMQVCLFYGIYPSLFSHNASEGNYFATETLYDRDRDLFARYIPLVKALSAAGWEPLTGVIASDPAVWVERYGVGPGTLYVTLRSTIETSMTATLTLDRARLGLTGPLEVTSLVVEAPEPWSVSADTSTLEVTLPGEGIEALGIVAADDP